MANIISTRTKSIDRTLRQLAGDFRRSDIKSVKVGEAQPAPHKEPPPGSGVLWKNPAELGTMKITPSIKGQPTGMQPSNLKLSGPQTGSYMADHEKLKIDK